MSEIEQQMEEKNVPIPFVDNIQPSCDIPLLFKIRDVESRTKKVIRKPDKKRGFVNWLMKTCTCSGISDEEVQ
ncbi:hypothetical protein ECANGB1_1929 [Enterospora canceri]|uniref:Uncharacterized protein n=1 Tax=Enterospora canceri TaxID=1081671 RepID=A0A1Y1S5B1_9MICR|nr:hypothetical protein ECANGB1_1929 [Enterospora canceri]